MAYSFPILTTSDIVQCLHDMGYKFSEEDITKPQPDIIRSFYEKILEVFMDYNKEQSQQIDFHAMNLLSNPELHDDSLGELSFLRSINKLMQNIGVHDFASKDIYKPEYQRTRRIFSGIINLAKFRDEKVHRLDELISRSSELIREKEKVDFEENRMFSNLDKLREKKNEYEKIVGGLQEELKIHTSKHNNLVNENNERKAIGKKLKETDEKLKDGIVTYNNGPLLDNYLFTISGLSDDCSKLEELVVRSPDRVKKLIEDMEISLKNEKELIIDDNQIMNRLQLKFARLEKIGKDIQKNLSLLELAAQEHDKYKKIKQKTKDAQKQITDHQKTSKELDALLLRLDKSIINVNETVQKNLDRFKVNKEEWMNTLKDIQNEKQALQKEHQDIAEKVDENLRAQRQMEDKIENLKLFYENENKQIIDHFQSLFLTISCKSEQNNNDSSSSGENPPNTKNPALLYYSIRRDLRLYAKNKGYILKSLNSPTNKVDELFVQKLDFTQMSRPINTTVLFDSGEIGTVIVYGYLNRKGDEEVSKLSNNKQFNVLSAYKMMEPIGVVKSDIPPIPSDPKFYLIDFLDIMCKKAPCDNYDLIPANFPSQAIRTIQPNHSNVYADHIDQDWYNYQSTRGMIHIVTNVNYTENPSQQPPQIIRSFAKLPDPESPCPRPIHVDCNVNKTNVWTRDHNRCYHGDGCIQVSIHSCPFIPALCTSPGYRLVSFPSKPLGCPKFFCDPDFLDTTPI
eukprot:gene9323-11430_t